MTIVETVVKVLDDAGIRAKRGYPTAVMPALTDVAAAVRLHELNQGKINACVAISVFAPPKIGAQACEDMALRVCRTLYAHGGICRAVAVDYLASADVFCTEVYATFSGRETENGWVVYYPPEE